ncbi:MAG: hypothetical protein RL518_1774 [Pseudomonadota bacterium]
MIDEENTPPRGGVVALVRTELVKFWKDPLFYALERSFSIFMLALGIYILASAVKILVSTVLSLGN